MSLATSGSRVAVIGDIAGHPRPLLRVLAGLGVDVDPEVVGLGAAKLRGDAVASVDMVWPDDLHVVSVGDIVHRGPDSDGVVALVDRLIRAGRWTQVVGNHEQLYVDRNAFGWPEKISDKSAALLESWWREGLMHASVAVSTVFGRDRIVCHGGLTTGFWEMIGSPTSAVQAAAAIRASGDAIWTPGVMLGYEPTRFAGPVWAESGSEVALSWLSSPDASTAVEFDQFHGHSSIVRWPKGEPRSQHLVDVLEKYGTEVFLDRERSHVHLTMHGHTVTGVDPGHGQSAVTPWGAAVVIGHVVAP